MMAALGAGAAGYYTAAGSGIFTRARLKNFGQFNEPSNQRYRRVFSKRAFKNALTEQKMREHQYLVCRRRTYYNARRLEESDSWKRLAAGLHRLTLPLLLVSLLICCCGFLPEWSRTFPLGNIAKAMNFNKQLGLSLLVVSVALLTISNLIYYKSDTGLSMLPFKFIHQNQVKKKTKSRKCKIIYSSHLVFYVGMAVFFVGWPLVAAGYVSEWAATYPTGPLLPGTRALVGASGISALLGGLLLMWAADCVSYSAQGLAELPWCASVVSPTDMEMPAVANDGNIKLA